MGNCNDSHALVNNIVYFARTLRAAGLPLGPGKVLDAIQAVRTVGITNRNDFFWTLHTVLVNRRDQRELFEQAFHVFWRNPRLLEQISALSMSVPDLQQPLAPEQQQQLLRRLGDALISDAKPRQEKATD